jgi:serine/threonine-protein kinase 24/25/MST4
MSPEVISGKEVDYKADIWSVGITAIEIAEKRVPNEELGSTFRVMRAITTNAPPTLRETHWSPQFVVNTCQA